MPVHHSTCAAEKTRLLTQAVRELLPLAVSVTYDWSQDADQGDQLHLLSIALPEAAFLPDHAGLYWPGPELAAQLAPLGWHPGVTDGDPVFDDVDHISIARPLDDSPEPLRRLWDLAEAAMLSTRRVDRDEPVPVHTTVHV